MTKPTIDIELRRAVLDVFRNNIAPALNTDSSAVRLDNIGAAIKKLEALDANAEGGK